jgi:Spy/CpxP family protein refolding chaperone
MLKILLVSLAIAGVAVGGFAWAKQNGYCSRSDLMGHVTERVARKLDLDDQQQAKLQTFAESLQSLRGDWSERRAAAREEVEALLASPSLDRERVMGLLDARHQALAEHQREVVDAFGEFSDSLRPEQRTRLAELIAQRMDHRWGPPHWAH